VVVRLFRWSISALVFVAVALLALFFWYRQASQPDHEGTIALTGLLREVRVVRDQNAVPVISAAGEADALFALGYVHAQDRLWQMDFNRRIARGRLAEVLGTSALESDRFIRTLGIARTADSIVARMDSEMRDLLGAYAAGVNAFLTTRRGPLPPEFLLTRAPAPELWTPEDSIGWALMMSWDMASAAYRSEIARLRLSARFSKREIDEFRPLSADEPAVAIADYVEQYRLLGLHSKALDDQLTRLAQTHPVAGFGSGEAIGSNSWVVGPARSASGKPLLANDPHLGLTAPAIWYIARLRAPGLDVFGFTLPGVPYVLLGRNAHVAWGFTNTGGDVQDVYIERLHPTETDQYQTPEGFVRFDEHVETIRVRGAEDVSLKVRRTRHGPVLSGASANVDKALPAAARERYVLALRWTALEAEDQTMRALRAMNRATDTKQFEHALVDWQLVQQTVLFAGDDGHFGMITPGRMPTRRPDNDFKGLAPAPGWDSRYDWAGWLSFEELPRAIDPSRGYFVSANHRVTAPEFPHFITAEWYLPYRARRIEQLLLAESKHSPASFKRMQADIVSLAAPDFLAVLRNAAPTTPAGRVALERLLAWNGAMRADAPEPLLLHAWLHKLRARIFDDDLRELSGAMVSNDELTLATLKVLRGESSARDWCDDVKTPTRRETCLELAGETLDQAVIELASTTGQDVAGLRWGDTRRALFEHRPLSTVPFLRDWFELRTPVGGDSYTVNVGRLSLRGAAPFNTRHAASMRAIYDLADPRAGAWMLGTGQSGHPLSDQYAAMLDNWRRVDYAPIRWEEPIATGLQAKVLVLKPSTRPAAGPAQ